MVSGVSNVFFLGRAGVGVVNVVGAVVVDAVDTAGNDDGSKAGDVVGNAESIAVTLHDVEFIGCLGVFRESVAGGHIGILACSIGQHFGEVFKSGVSGRGRNGKAQCYGQRQYQGNKMAKDLFRGGSPL